MEAETLEDILQAGDVLLSTGRYEEARDMAVRALSVDPTSAPAHMLDALALMGLRRHRQAIEAARAAVSADPQSPSTHMLLSQAIARSPHHDMRPFSDEAIGPAREAVRLAPADWRAHLTLARAYGGSKLIPEADRAIRQAISLNPRSADVWVVGSYIALQHQNWYAAEDAARRALALEPDSQAATTNLGIAMRNQGKGGLGAVAFLDAARIDPRSEGARENVENIGFLHMARYAAVLVAPLAFIPFFFLYARRALLGWLYGKPTALRPLARRVGVRVASSDRYRRQFEEESSRAQRHLSDGDSVASWSALDHGKRPKAELLAGLVTFVVVAGIVVAGFALASAKPRDHSVVVGGVVVLILLGAGPLYRKMKSRRRY